MVQIPPQWNDVLERMPELREEFLEQQQGDAHQLFPSFFLHAFRPDGEGIADFVLPFPGGQALLERLQDLYRVTAANRSTMYFVPPETPEPPQETLQRLAEAFVAGQKQLMRRFDLGGEELADHPQLLRMPSEEYHRRYTETMDTAMEICDAFRDLHRSLCARDHNPLLRLYSDPLYMVGCDYTLAQYLIWPLVREETGLPDPLLPYYQLWRLRLQPVQADEQTVWLVG